MKINYGDINSVQIGAKYVLDNSLGIVSGVEKTKVVAKVLEIINDKKVKIEVNSMLNRTTVEAEADFYLLK